MSEVASLELRVSSDGVATADKRLQGLTASGARAEGASRRCASSIEEIDAAAKKTQATLDRLNAAVSRNLTRDNERLAATYRTAASKMTLPGQTGELPAALAGGVGERATASLQMFRKAQSDVVAAEAAMVAKMREADAAAGEKSGTFGRLTTAAKGLVLPLIAVGSATAAAHKVIGETVAYENLIARLSGVTGGAGEAAAAFDALEKISDKTIFTENQMTEAFLHLEQTGLDGSERSLKAFANIASATGQGMDQLAEMTLSASMGIFRSLRSMGIRAEADGDKIRMTFRGTTTTIGKSAQEIQGYLVKIGETQFAGAAARQLDTMGGSVKKLGDAWGDLFREVGRGVIGDFIKTSFDAATMAVQGTTKVVEGLLYTLSKKPKEMSAEKQAILAGFLGEEEWGASKGSIEERYAALMAKQESAFANKDQQRALEEYRDRVKEIKELSLEAMQSGYAFDARTMLASAEEEYIRKAGGKADNTSKLEAEAKARKAAMEKTAKDLAAFERATRAKTAQELADEAQDELDKWHVSQAEKLQGIREGLRSEKEALRASYDERRKIIEEYATDEEKGGPESPFAGLLEQLDKKHDKEMRAIVDAEDQKRAALRDGLRTEEEELTASYERRLADLQRAVDDEVMLTEEAEELKAKLRQKYEREQEEMALARIAQGTQNAEALFGNLSEVAKNFGGEQSGAYRAMFATQKAFAVASATVAGGQAMAEAMKLGWPQGIPAGIAAMAQIAKAISIISSANYSGAYDSGGFIPAGKWGIAGERGPEVVQGPAQVTSRTDTARMLGKQSVTVVVAPDQAAAEQYMTSAAGDRAFLALARKHSVAIRRMVGA